MSRTKAKATLGMDKFKEQMASVYSQSINEEHLDEAPDSYKNINEVMDNQRDLVDIRVKLEPILNIKG